MKVKQVQIVAIELTPAILVCWVEDDPRIVKDAKITLKDFPDVMWLVDKVFDVVLDSKELYKPWRVGGIE